MGVFNMPIKQVKWSMNLFIFQNMLFVRFAESSLDLHYLHISDIWDVCMDQPPSPRHLPRCPQDGGGGGAHVLHHVQRRQRHLWISQYRLHFCCFSFLFIVCLCVVIGDAGGQFVCVLL